MCLNRFFYFRHNVCMVTEDIGTDALFGVLRVRMNEVR